MNDWQGSVSTYGGGVMASQPSTFQYHNASAIPAHVQAQDVQVPQHTAPVPQEDGLSVLRNLVQGPEQAIWLQQELAKRPLRPGQSPLHWVIWREKCEEGYDQNTAWVLAVEDERKATHAQEAQQSQSQQQSVQSATPTTINPAQIHAVAPYQAGPSQTYGSFAQTRYVGYVGGPLEDPRQGGHAHMHNASPVQPMNNVPHPPQVAPPSISYGPGDVTTGQPVASSSKQTLDTPSLPRAPSDDLLAHGSPFDTLPSSFSHNFPLSTSYHPLHLHRVTYAKRPIMSLSVFDKLVPLPSNRATSTWSSSALDRKPTKGEREALAAKRAKVAAEEKPSNWATAQSLITPEALLSGKPLPLFKLLRARRDAQDNLLSPVFVPNPTQTLEILVQLKNHAPPIYLERVGDNEKYALVLRRWMMKATKEPKEWEKCIAPLFQVLGKTPIPMETILDYDFGRHAKNLSDKAEKAGIQGLRDIVVAYKHYEKFVMTLAAQEEAKKREEAKGGAKEQVAARAGDASAAKKQKTDDGSARPVVKPEPSELTKASSNKTSADMSFFGSTSTAGAGPSRPRAKLPDIKKRDLSDLPLALVAPIPSPAAGLLAATMQALRQPSQPMTAALTTSVPEVVEVKPTGPKPNKKGHVVRFRDSVADGGELVNVREFKEEVWELERPPWQHDEDVAGKTAAQLDMGEGRALRIHESMEAEIDWYEPHLYEGGRDPIGPTPETIEQETRERGILSVVYNPGQVPPDPDENGVRVVQRGPSTGTWWPPSHDFGVPPPQAAQVPDPQAAASVSALLGSLRPEMFNTQTHSPTPPPAAQGYAYGQTGAYDYSYGNQQAYQPPPQPGYGGWNDPSAPGPSGVNGYRGYGYEQQNDRRDTGYGGRGRGGPSNRNQSGNRGGKRSGNIVCKHWLVNACYKGDSCTYKHSRD